MIFTALLYSVEASVPCGLCPGLTEDKLECSHSPRTSVDRSSVEAPLIFTELPQYQGFPLSGSDPPTPLRVGAESDTQKASSECRKTKPKGQHPCHCTDGKAKTSQEQGRLSPPRASWKPGLHSGLLSFSLHKGFCPPHGPQGFTP